MYDLKIKNNDWSSDVRLNIEWEKWTDVVGEIWSVLWDVVDELAMKYNALNPAAKEADVQSYKENLYVSLLGNIIQHIMKNTMYWIWLGSARGDTHLTDVYMKNWAFFRLSTLLMYGWISLKWTNMNKDDLQFLIDNPIEALSTIVWEFNKKSNDIQ